MAQQDPDGDGLVSLEEMLVSSFSYTSEELSKFAKDENRDIQAFMDVSPLLTVRRQMRLIAKTYFRKVVFTLPFAIHHSSISS